MRRRSLAHVPFGGRGEEIAVAPQAEDDTPVPDLMAALEASLAEVRSGDSDKPTSKPPAKKPAAKRSASAKPAAKRTKAKT